MDERINDFKQKEKDELDIFIVDENEPLDKKTFAEIIKPFVESIGKNKIISFTEKFQKSNNWVKILIYLCCRKLMFVKGIIQKEEVGPKEISDGAFINESAAKKIATNTLLKKLTKKGKEGYYIPNYNIKKIKETVGLINYG